MFLELNGYTLHSPEANAVVFLEQLVAGKVNKKELAESFAANIGLK